MKRIVVPCLLLLVVVGCSDRPKGTPQKSLTADDVLRAYAQRVHSELLPRANELTEQQIIKVVGQIATEELVPHKDLLFQKAGAELAEILASCKGGGLCVF